ncbi:MAG: hypothetical protein AAB869_02420 [Patescibacteria group bacterium]
MTFALAVLVLGVVVYGIDAVYGKELFRNLYKATHPKDSTPPADSPGFIVGRTVKGRVLSALILTAALTFLLGISTAHSLLGLIWNSVVEFAMLMLGFTAAAVVHHRFDPAGKAAKVAEVLEGLESGAIDPAEQAREAMHTAAEKIKAVTAEMMGGTHTPRTPASPPPVSTEAASQAPGAPEAPDAQAKEPTRTFDEALERFRKS